MFTKLKLKIHNSFSLILQLSYQNIFTKLPLFGPPINKHLQTKQKQQQKQQQIKQIWTSVSQNY